MTKKTALIGLFLYLLSAGLSFATFRYLLPSSDTLINPSPTVYEEGQLVIDPGEPKDQTCPLNGEMYTKTERSAWEKRRPLLVMIENHHESRPPSGLSQADIVYEAVAEGGITRFMAVFYCDAISQDNLIGPVRSARTYYLDWASEYSKNPLYVHVGGGNTPNKANALGQIVDYGWASENDLNQFALTVKECWRDDSILKKALGVSYVPAEHTMQCSSEALWKVAATRGWAAKGEDGKLWSDQFTPWKFDDPKPASSPEATTISFDFWDDFTQYTVRWDYDPASNIYSRSNGGNKHIDNTNQQQLSARVVVIQFAKETGPIDEVKHMLYGTIGTGDAIIFQDGKALKATWSKKDRLSRTIFSDSSGKEIKFSRGKIYIEVVPKGNKINY